MAEISDIDFWKKAQNRRFLGSPTSKIFFDKLSIKKLGHTKNFGRDPPHRHFRAYFWKNAVEIFIFQISPVICSETSWKVWLLSPKVRGDESSPTTGFEKPVVAQKKTGCYSKKNRLLPKKNRLLSKKKPVVKKKGTGCCSKKNRLLPKKPGCWFVLKPVVDSCLCRAFILNRSTFSVRMGIRRNVWLFQYQNLLENHSKLKEPKNLRSRVFIRKFWLVDN